MSVEGSLDLFQLPEILQTVAHQQKTGILTIQGQNDIVAISFLGGKVVAADSLNQAGDQGLVDLLRREQLAGEEDLRQALALQEQSGARLQDVLLDNAFLSRPELLAVLRLQYQELLGGLLGWREGEFKFYTNDEVAFEEGLTPIVVQDLLMRYLAPDEIDEESLALEALMPSDEPPVTPPVAPPMASPMASTASGRVDTDRALDRLPNPRPIKVRASGTDATSDDEGFVVLSPLEQQILGRVNGERNIAELALDCGLDAHWVQGAVDRLVDLGLVRPAAAHGAGAHGAAAHGAAARGATAELPLFDEAPEVTDADLGDLFDIDAELGVPERRRSRVDRELLFSWGARLLAGVGALALLVALLRHPQAVLLPMPWQQEQRLGMIAQQRDAAYLKIDRAAKTYFLMQGRFPEQLDTLVRSHLLPGDLLTDPEGRPLIYGPGDVQYQLEPLGLDGEPQVELGASEAITGNFLLDLDFFSIPTDSLQQPLVLID